MILGAAIELLKLAAQHPKVAEQAGKIGENIFDAISKGNLTRDEAKELAKKNWEDAEFHMDNDNEKEFNDAFYERMKRQHPR